MKRGFTIAISITLAAVFLGAFIFGGYQIFSILHGYNEGDSEYEDILEEAATSDVNLVFQDDDEPASAEDTGAADNTEDFSVDFDVLAKKNKDTVGWIRFYPEPSEINYPVVQTKDNETYLNRTFSGKENTLGAIFVNCDNSPDFSDANTIIYGHRMKNKSMFYQLQSYKESSFREANPYFYIYTPDGRKLVYEVFSVGQVNSESSTYNTFFDEEGFNRFLSDIKKVQYYDTGIDVKFGDKVVTLSTCTAASDDNRLTVRGVLVDEMTFFDGGD